MKSPSTSTVISTSFTNEPQAIDDFYSLANDTYGDGIYYFDVMSNDLGGNAKSLFSVDDGTSPGGGQTDLLTKDISRAESTGGDRSAHGAAIWITSDGKIGYDGSTLSDDFKSELLALHAGQYLTDTFTYSIRLADGTLSWATVMVQFTNANEPATISVVGSQDTTVVEAGGVNNGFVGDPSASGQLSVQDVDNGENHFQTPASLDGSYGTYTFLPATGTWTFTLDQALADPMTAGQVVYDHLIVTSADSTASYDIAITITGSNDAPVAVADTNAGLEDSTISGSVATNDSDADDGAGLTYSLDAPVAGLSLNPDGSYSLDASNAAYRHLAAGASTDVVASYTIGDEHGATASSTLTITLTGVNDAPVVTSLNAPETYTEDTPLNLTDIVVSDADSSSVTVTLTLSNTGAGSLSVGTFGSMSSSFSAGVWSATGAMTDVNAALAAVTFNPTLNFNSSFTIATSVSDGVAPTVTGLKTVTGTPVNDSPVATITPAVYVTIEKISLNLKNNGLSISDVDATSGSMTVTLAVSEGTLTVTAGGSGALVSNSETSSVTITGTVAQINALLNTDATSTVAYVDKTDTPSAGAMLSLTAHDNGNTGGGDLSSNDTATINITAVDDGSTAGGRWIFSPATGSGFSGVVLGINNGVAPIFPLPQAGKLNFEVFTNSTVSALPGPDPGFQTTILDTAGRLEDGFLTGTALQLGGGDFLVVDSVTGASTQSPSKITLGTGNQTVVGTRFDTIIGGSGNQVLSALVGDETVVGGTSNDSVWGGPNDSIVAGSGDNQIVVIGWETTVVAGAAGNSTMSLATGDTVTALPGNQNVVISAASYVYIDLTGNTGLNGVIGSSGDTIIAGRGTTNVEGVNGGMLIKVGAAGRTNVSGSGNPLAGSNTVIGGSGELDYNPSLVSGAGDLIDLSGSGGTAQINAFSFGAVRSFGRDTILGSNTADSVFGGDGDRMGTGRGPVVGGTHQWVHADTVAGSSVGFGSNDTVSSTSYDTATGVAIRGMVAGTSSAQVTVGGFNTTTDFLFYQNETAATNAAIIATSQATTVNGIPSTILVIPDGTVMTLVGVSQAQLTAALNAGTLFKL
jgi:VCBS repeat-containing protein